MFNDNPDYEANCVRLMDCVRYPSMSDERGALDQSTMLVLQRVLKQQVLDTFLKLYIKRAHLATQFLNEPRQLFVLMPELRQSQQLQLRQPRQVLACVGGFNNNSRDVSSPALCTLDPAELFVDVEDFVPPEPPQPLPRQSHYRVCDFESLKPNVEAYMCYSRAYALGQLRSQQVTFTAHSHLQLPVALCEHSMCCLDGVLYVAGGQTKYSDIGSGATPGMSSRWEVRSSCHWLIGLFQP